MLGLAKELKKHLKIYILTDALDFDNEDRLVLERIYPLFDGVYRSFEMGLRKNDRRIFDTFLLKTKHSPESSLIIDDKPEAITIADSIGMKGVLYTDNQSLVSKLSSFGVKV